MRSARDGSAEMIDRTHDPELKSWVESASQADTKRAEIQDAIDGLSRRAANIRAGHVYVISNIGAFGPDMVKIGMTRRLDPQDRVRELGDASVPFHYDLAFDVQLSRARFDGKEFFPRDRNE